MARLLHCLSPGLRGQELDAFHFEDVESVVALSDDHGAAIMGEQYLVRMLHTNGLAVDVDVERLERCLVKDFFEL